MSRILQGDCRDVLRTLADGSVNCCVTSPPYYGLRDYDVEGQRGLESTPDQYIAELVADFREVRRVLRNDGTLWLNIGDSYAGSRAGPQGQTGDMHGHSAEALECRTASAGMIARGKRNAKRWGGGNLPHGGGIKSKDLIGIPWMLAFALRADGWYLRQDIIWSKPNPMPESVKDRCTKAHEYLFLLSKSSRYYFNSEAIAEPLAASSVARLMQPNIDNQVGSDRVPGKTNGRMKAVGSLRNTFARNGKLSDGGHGQTAQHRAGREPIDYSTGTRNKRSVWSIPTKPYKEAHFATFPPALVEPCILAGCPAGGLVLDPFGGAGTTGLVADRLGRASILIELNSKYVGIASRRIDAALKEVRA